ncbi:MAG: ABC transporter ATP-binding protein [Gemmatimonadetes bacterium]|nr:ABC transporter ATP-binding protein [Gemmatimonadota bacterium]MBT7858775.1 ABC transporter ATP-binding protein [Gemmatimonadota bacterium]
MAHRPRRRWHHDRSPNSSHLPPPRSCHAVTHSVLETRQLTKTYTSGDRPLTVLDNVSIAIEAGSTSAIVGPSGSGKTTLLGLCAGLDRATSGSVILDGVSLDGLDEDARARLRNERVGFVFQTFQLVPTLSAIENVGVPLELRGERKVTEQAKEWLTRVGLGDRLHHYPSQLSGGEQQRVGIARAFINRPRILFADEPTGSLDGQTGAAVEELLFEINAEAETTLILVTHDADLAARAGRVIRLRDGRVIEDSSPTDDQTHDQTHDQAHHQSGDSA